jgi:1-acyl-sn-glycerol-3-phosphate acyltransferase
MMPQEQTPQTMGRSRWPASLAALGPNELLGAGCARLIAGFARLVTGVRGEWRGCAPQPRRRVYFANHRSHGDFVLVWTVLPIALRGVTRPVAGADYWLKGSIRRFIAKHVFHAVLIERDAQTRAVDPIAVMTTALEDNSLILFPEGTRNTTAESMLPFRTGLYHVAKARPDVELVPVWIENLNRVMPKGEVVPIPLLCTVTFGTPIALGRDEDKAAFLDRCRNAVLALAPGNGTDR